jgi:tRNA dimethylallyltransferase
MDIGTAKPGTQERARVPHHLIDIVAPDEAYSTGRWLGDALRAVATIHAAGRIPLIVGGTMLYYRALVAGMDALPQADRTVRAAIDSEAASRGWPALHAELERVDPASARRIAPRDSQRIQRALEVWRLTGKPLSALLGAGRRELPFRLKAFALVPADREALRARIAQRFDAMLAAGLVDEVRGLRKRYQLSPAMPSMRVVGYRQVWEHLEDALDEATMTARAVTATRQLAKRQLTWLRSFSGLVPLASGGAREAAVALQAMLRELA